MTDQAIKYFENEQYDSAAYEFKSALDLVDQNPGIVDSLNRIGLIMYNGVACHYAALYEQAENYYLRANLIFENSGATFDQGYAINLNNLAKLYDELGCYEKAEQIFLKVKDIDKIIQGENNPDYAIILSNIGLLYFKMGRYSQAESLYMEALELIESNLGRNHPKYALYSNFLGQLYLALGNYTMADSMLSQAVQIAEKITGAEQLQYAKYLNNLAYLYFVEGDYYRAENIFRKSIEIDLSLKGENHPDYAVKLNNLAAVYIEMNAFEKAEPILRQALEIDRSRLGENHPACAPVLNNLARLYLLKGYEKQAISLYQEAFFIYKYLIEKNTGFLSEKEFEQYLNTFLSNLDIYQSTNYTIHREYPYVNDFAYNLELTRKGILLKSALELKIKIMQSEDESLKNAFYQLIFLKKKINDREYIYSDSLVTDLSEMREKANKLEKEIRFETKDYDLAIQNAEINLKDIVNNLSANEVSIEMSSFHYFDGKKLTDSLLYSAIVVKKFDTLTHFLFLCEEKQLKAALPSSGTDPKSIDLSYKNPSLYNLIWKPIDSLLQEQEINTVYFAPSGLLNSVAFSAIRCPDGKLLSEKYNLVQLSSTRTLAMPEEPVTITDAVIYGGIKYDPDTTGWIASAEKYKKEESDILAYNAPFRGLTRGGWVYLPGSKKEMTQIAGHLAHKGIDTTTFTGANALEESFYSLSGNNSPSIIHISTHGFYYPDTVSDEYRKNMMNSATGDIQFKYADDPLLRSGLILAGGNNTWKGLPRPEGLEDGILTAREVSNMNLLNTELVVLSACQTGQGDVKGSEGVEGLQRGFKMAGVHFLIMSLWEVPDKETTEFMDQFYSLWPGDLSIRDAFRETQLKMMHKYPNEPHKWAGFVLME